MITTNKLNVIFQKTDVLTIRKKFPHAFVENVFEEFIVQELLS